MRLDKNSVALAGEFAVLSQLALRGYNASMTLGHTKGIDILVSDPQTKKMYRLEVKTKYRRSSKEQHNSKLFGPVLGQWMMSKAQEGETDPSLFYCFAICAEREFKFRFFIVPSKIVAGYLRNEHRLWLSVKKKETKKGKDTKIRVFRLGFEKHRHKYAVATPLVEKYENNWKFDSP